MTSRALKILALSQQPIPQKPSSKEHNLFLPGYETTKGLVAEDQQVAIEAFNNGILFQDGISSSGSEYFPSEASDSSNSALLLRKRKSKRQNVAPKNNEKVVILEDITLKKANEKQVTNIPKLETSGKEFIMTKFLDSTASSFGIHNELKEGKMSVTNVKETPKRSPWKCGTKQKNKTTENVTLKIPNEGQELHKNIPKVDKSNAEFTIKNTSGGDELDNELQGNDICEISARETLTNGAHKRVSNETTTTESSLGVIRTNPMNNIEIVAASKKDGKRLRNKTHVCYYCNRHLINMARHFELVHSTEREVAKNLVYPKKSDLRRKAFSDIIRAGNFYHNCNVLSTKMGELVLVRRPTKNELKTVTDADYGPCPNCLGFMLKKHIWHHLKHTCREKVLDIDKQNAKDIVAESNALISDIFGLGFTKEYHKAIISAFRTDEIGNICKNDVLILKFGAMQFEKYADAQSEFIRQTMRQLARLTLALNKIEKITKSLADFLCPDKFDLVVQATKEVSMNPITLGTASRPEFHTPSLALKIGYALKKCIAIQRGNALRAGNIKLNKSLLSFKELIDMEWNIRISSNALSTLYRRKFNATQLLPVTDDLVKLSKYIDSNISKVMLEIESDSLDNQAWTRLATLCLSRIILFNKRRSGEASKMKMSDYISRPSWGENTEEMRQSLTAVEKKLAESMTMVEVEGKRGRKVPILLPPLIKECVDILIRRRDACRISMHNKYIFARSHESTRYLRGHDCLKKICEELHLENPDAITGTKLRKYVATVCQLFNMTENEYDWLARHLGHDIKVHREFYRMHESAIELTKISRILIAVDQGEAHKYAGKAIGEIQIQDLPDVDPNDEISNDENSENEDGDDEKIVEENNLGRKHDRQQKTKRDVEKKGKNGRKPQTWSAEELTALVGFFKLNIKKNIVPSKKQCQECIEKSSILSSRPWKNIKYAVKNQISKNNKKINN